MTTAHSHPPLLATPDAIAVAAHTPVHEQPIVEAKGLWTVFGKGTEAFAVHQDLEFVVQRGEMLSLVGGSAGAALLLVTPDATFKKIIPWLLLAATALFAFGPQLRQWLGAGAHPASAAKAGLGTLAVAAYGGYFNGGLGILLLALFGLLGQTQLNAMNGMKNLVSALLTAIAVAIYAAGGIVQWQQALIMMIAATLGGYWGARVARRLPAPALRWGIVATGLVMAGLFFWKQ